MYVIAVGSPFDGVTLYAGPDGFAWRDPEAASDVAEQLFGNQDWWIVPINSIADVAGAEDNAGE